MPGAGKYDVKAKDKIDFPKWTMPGEARFPTKGPGGPGPGNYNYPSFITAGPKFTTRIKPYIDPLKCRTKPGPGDHDPKIQFSEVKYSIGNKLSRSIDPMKVPPGPGSYNDMR